MSEESKPSAYADIETRAKKIGVNLSEVCRKAGVDRSVLERWKKEDPKSITTFNALNAALDEIESEKDAE